MSNNSVFSQKTNGFLMEIMTLFFAIKKTFTQLANILF